jgi:hypothetical protein
MTQGIGGYRRTDTDELLRRAMEDSGDHDPSCIKDETGRDLHFDASRPTSVARARSAAARSPGGVARFEPPGQRLRERGKCYPCSWFKVLPELLVAQRRPARGLGRPHGDLGRPPRGLGRPHGGLGRPARGLGRPHGGLGRPARGFGKPAHPRVKAPRYSSTASRHVLPVARRPCRSAMHIRPASMHACSGAFPKPRPARPQCIAAIHVGRVDRRKRRAAFPVLPTAFPVLPAARHICIAAVLECRAGLLEPPASLLEVPAGFPKLRGDGGFLPVDGRLCTAAFLESIDALPRRRAPVR